MIYVALWLIFGCVGYMLALAMRMEELEARIGKLEFKKSEPVSNASYGRGLAGILLGPLTIALVFYLTRSER